jgi:hypothetical protein
MQRLVLSFLLLAVSPMAQANTVGCGDNAYSYAEVVARPRGVRERGPIASLPDSLCADLIEVRPRHVDQLNFSIGEPSLRGPPPRREPQAPVFPYR